MQTHEARRRWGAGRREDDLESGRVCILAAAIQCYERQGVVETKIEDVARAAQISRRTLYRYFPSRQDLIRGVVEQQAVVFLEELRKLTLRHKGNFRSLLVKSVLFSIEHGPGAARYKLLLQGSNALNGAQYYLSESVMARWEAILSDPFTEARAQAEIPESIRLPALVEWMGRLVLSWIQFPASPAQVRKQLEMLLLPGLE